MKANMGLWDRAIRVIIAAVISYMYYSGILSGTLGLVLMVMAIVFLLTSVVSICPIYSILGIKTCKTKN